MNETTMTAVGNLTDKPELKITPGGAALCRFSIAVNPRVYDAKTRTWRDGDPLFLSCTAWRDLAENIAESDLAKGTRVVVTGRLRMSQWQTNAGDKRTVWELTADEIGISLRHATAQPTKTTRTAAARAGAPF